MLPSLVPKLNLVELNWLVFQLYFTQAVKAKEK